MNQEKYTERLRGFLQSAQMLALLEQNLVLSQRIQELSQRIETLTAEVHQRLVNHEA